MSCCFVDEFCAAVAVTSRLVPCCAAELGSKKVARCSLFVRLNAKYAPFERGMALSGARVWALVFPGERGTPFSGAGRKRSQRSTPHPVFWHSVHPLRYCMGLYGIARPMTLCRGRSHGPSAKSLATDVSDGKLCCPALRADFLD